MKENSLQCQIRIGVFPNACITQTHNRGSMKDLYTRSDNLMHYKQFYDHFTSFAVNARSSILFTVFFLFSRLRLGRNICICNRPTLCILIILVRHDLAPKNLTLRTLVLNILFSQQLLKLSLINKICLMVRLMFKFN